MSSAGGGDAEDAADMILLEMVKTNIKDRRIRARIMFFLKYSESMCNKFATIIKTADGSPWNWNSIGIQKKGKILLAFSVKNDKLIKHMYNTRTRLLEENPMRGVIVTKINSEDGVLLEQQHVKRVVDSFKIAIEHGYEAALQVERSLNKSRAGVMENNYTNNATVFWGDPDIPWEDPENFPYVPLDSIDFGNDISSVEGISRRNQQAHERWLEQHSVGPVSGHFNAGASSSEPTPRERRQLLGMEHSVEHELAESESIWGVGVSTGGGESKDNTSSQGGEGKDNIHMDEDTLYSKGWGNQLYF